MIRYGDDAAAMKENRSLGRIISPHHAQRLGRMLAATQGHVLQVRQVSQCACAISQ